MTKFMIDIDGTICHTICNFYTGAEPDQFRIDHFNSLYDDGHEIHYWTARGSGSGKDWREFTKRQLEGWGVKSTSINCGKPLYDVWIDDKSINDVAYFDIIKKSGDEK